MVSYAQIEGCLKNKAQSQRELYEACAPYVYSIVRTYIFDQEFRKDVVQDVFANIFNSLSNYREEKGSFKTWIRTITVNRSITMLKKHSAIQYTFELERVSELADDQFSFLDKLSREDIEAFFLDMPVGYRTVFFLSVLDDYKHKEIAELLSIKPETSRSQLLRAINWIKKNHKIIKELKKLNYGAL